jgi:hypothetical protein
MKKIRRAVQDFGVGSDEVLVGEVRHAASKKNELYEIDKII